MSCAACRTAIEEGDGLQCTIEVCNKQYHLLCIGEANPGKELWVCPECRCATKKGGDNSLTPVGSKKSRDTNITFRKKPPSHIDEGQVSKNEDKDVRAVMRSLMQEISLLRQLLEHSVAIIKMNEVKIENYLAQMDVLNNKLSEYETANAAISAELKHYVAKVEKLNREIGRNGNLQTAVASQHEEKSPLRDLSVKGKRNDKVTKGPTGCTPIKNHPRTESTPSSSTVPNLSTALRKSDKVVAITNREVNAEEGKKSKLTVQTPLPEEAQWTEVKKKSRRPTSMCGIAGPTVTTLKAVEPRKYLHLWNMESSADEISKYLRQLCPNGTCTLEELKSRGNYKSYKIGVPVVYYETCFSVNVWPVNARIKAWVTFKKPENQRTYPEVNQSFRDFPKA